MPSPRCAVLPAGDHAGPVEDAVRAGGGQVVEPEGAEALIWVDPAATDGLQAALAANPDIGWVQLPWAGIEPFAGLLDRERHWTCAKGAYAEPVAEHALALLLSGMRAVVAYSRRRSWSAPHGDNLLGARVTILGGGGIATSLVRLLGPFDARVTVVRRHPAAMDGVERVVGTDRLHDALADADAVVLALSLTPETTGIVDEAALAAMGERTWLVNVARGGHVDTGALVEALRAGRIGGAAMDVTDPEPLPDGHPLWDLDRCVVTPHVADTPEMRRPLFAARVRENVARRAEGRPLLGAVDVDLGY